MVTREQFLKRETKEAKRRAERPPEERTGRAEVVD